MSASPVNKSFNFAAWKLKEQSFIQFFFEAMS